MKTIRIAIAFLLLAAPAYAKNIIEYTEDTTPTADDMVLVDDNPAGTPVTKSVTLGNAIKKAHGLTGAGFVIIGADNIMALVKSNLTATTAPTANDDTGDGYAVGSIWLDTVTDYVYLCADATAAAAVWSNLSTGGGSVPDGDASGDLLQWSGSAWAAVSELANVSLSGGTATTPAYWNSSGILDPFTSGNVPMPDAGGWSINVSATDAKYSGITMNRTAGETLAFGNLVYYKSDSKVWKADADAIATMPCIGVVVVGGSADATVTILTHGSVTETDWNFTVGGMLYVGETAGAIEGTLSNISDTNDVVQVIGVALSADTIFFNPSLSMVVLD